MNRFNCECIIDIIVCQVVDITPKSWNHLQTWIFEASEAILGLNSIETA